MTVTKTSVQTFEQAHVADQHTGLPECCSACARPAVGSANEHTATDDKKERREKPELLVERCIAFDLDTRPSRCLWHHGLAGKCVPPEKGYGVRRLGNAAPVYAHTSFCIASNTSNELHAFLWHSGSGMQDLGTLGGTSSGALGINNRGQVVGYSETVSGSPQNHAFLWQSETGMQDQLHWQVRTSLDVAPGKADR